MITPLLIPQDKRIYHYCTDCYLIFVDTVYHLDKEKEKQILTNRNQSIERQEYVNYISQVIKLTLPHITEEEIGLDYGCGPTPTLTYLLKKENITCFNNDYNFGFTHPYKQYDFIFAIECLEKFKEPNVEFDFLLDHLKIGGILGLMTNTYPEKESFRHWHKRQDPTHVSFYHQRTLDYFMSSKGLELVDSDSDKVYVFRKKVGEPHLEKKNLKMENLGS
ncbi:methyltransferase domain-containing protein [Litoribacter populi]|uniref:methyltransferase domain-containing protein n=1 Tax=Litoribacter populi TaxID=2598460 RepID=UPI00163D87EE|nr:methyltransferase domain-containing protein [Litoribacter populi]